MDTVRGVLLDFSSSFSGAETLCLSIFLGLRTGESGDSTYR